MLLLVQAAIVIYVATISFLITVLYETDTFAFRATEFDWWLQGARKLAIVAVATAIITSFIYVVNKRLFRWIGLRNPRLALFVSATAGVLVLGAGTVGTAMFIYSKPFI